MCCLSLSDKPTWYYSKMNSQERTLAGKMKVHKETKSSSSGSKISIKYEGCYRRNSWSLECWHCYHSRDSSMNTDKLIEGTPSIRKVVVMKKIKLSQRKWHQKKKNRIKGIFGDLAQYWNTKKSKLEADSNLETVW